MINHTDLFATLAELLDVETGDPTRQRGTTNENSDGSTPSLTCRVSFDLPPDSYSFFSVLMNPDSEHRRPGMAVTPGSYRLGDWKLRFARGGARAVERAAADAVLHNLAEDPAEGKDLSESHSETKSRLFAEYQQFIAERKLKPLAVQVAARKSEMMGKKKTPSPRTGAAKKSNNQKPASSGVQIPEDLTEEQRAKVASLNNENRKHRAELQKQLEDLLTDEQKQARDVARKKALQEGKGGVKLRAAMDEALNLTPMQEKRFTDLREAIGRLTREHRQNLQKIQQDSDNAKPGSEKATSTSAGTAQAAWIEPCRDQRKAKSVWC